MSDSKPTRPKARLPRGFRDRGAAEIAAERRDAGHHPRASMSPTASTPLETPAFEYTDALGKFLPDVDRPNEGVFSLKDDDEQWLSLRYDLTAPLARYVAENFQNLRQALPPLSGGPGVAQRKAGAGALPRIHPVRRRHGGQRIARRRRRTADDAVPTRWRRWA